MQQFFQASEQPRILGLTAALFRKRVKLHQVRSEINKLTESMKCVVKLPNDPTNIYKYGFLFFFTLVLWISIDSYIYFSHIYSHINFPETVQSPLNI